MKYSHFFNFVFQSTLLQEERLLYTNQMHSDYSFNPRSYKRSDRIFAYLLSSIRTFNPRSYKRSDLNHVRLRQYSWLSIHAPTRGATVDVPPEWFVPITFNPRSYKRSDNHTRLSLYPSFYFQSTLLQEERRWISIYPRNDTSFNPRSYKRSDPTRTPTGKP